MKKIILLMLFINMSMVYANENYKFRIMGNSINNDITELPDKSIFNMFSSDEEDDQSNDQASNVPPNDDDSESLETRIRNDFPSDITVIIR